MAKIKTVPLAALCAIVLVSCPIFPDPGFKKPAENLDVFYAQNITTEKYYQVKAERLFEGKKCEIWAEERSGITAAMAENIAREYDNVIRPRIVDVFSDKNFTFSFNGREYDFVDMLDYANWLANRNNGKLTILLLDIKDGFKDPGKDSYVAGYFDAANFWPKGKVGNSASYSNGRDMIYVDTNPGLKTETRQTYATFAHELQHLVNFATTVLINRVNSRNELLLTDTWVNEGLSAYAEYLYLAEHPRDRLIWLGDDRNTISTGNNFFVWGNHDDEPLAILDDYATVYLFFQWLYLQAADTELQSRIFREIAYSDYSDYRAVTSVAAQINPEWSDWGVLLRTWLAANSYPENPYGYTGDTELQKTIKIAPISAAGDKILLYPGEGVYSIIDDPYDAKNAGNIRYAGLGNTGVINTSPPYTENILLTFNANTNNSKTTRSENGSLTGVPASAASQTAADNARSAERTRPYVIDAQDLLGRDRDKPIRLPR